MRRRGIATDTRHMDIHGSLPIAGSPLPSVPQAPLRRGAEVMHRRPASRGAKVLAGILFVTAPIVCFVGWFLTGISACCGSPTPPDETAQTLGWLAATGMVIVGMALLSGFRAGRRVTPDATTLDR